MYNNYNNNLIIPQNSTLNSQSNFFPNNNNNLISPSLQIGAGGLNQNTLTKDTSNNIFVPLKDQSSLHTNHKSDDLPRLGRKKSSGLRKSVSFKNEVSITKVESWKEYNKDVSEETELFKLKQQIKEFKLQQALKAKEKEKECCCEIF